MAKSPRKPAGSVGAFSVPLTDKQLIYLARASALWAQVDFFLDQLLMHVNHLNQQQFDVIIGDKMVGTKLGLLEQTLFMVEDVAQLEAIKRFIKAADAVKSQRNHATHGVWGLRVSERSEFVAARAARTPSKPLRPERLKKLEKDMAETAFAGSQAFATFTGHQIERGGRFLFGASDDMPKRLGGSLPILQPGRPNPARKPKAKVAPPPASGG